MMVLVALPSSPQGGLIPDFLGVGTCKDLHLQAHFNPSMYSGYWFTQRKVPNKYTITSDCTTNFMAYTGTSINVTAEGLGHDGEPVDPPDVVQMIPNTDHHLSSPANWQVQKDPFPPYMVVSTDYTSYSCVYSCMQYSFMIAEFLWILSRTPEMSNDRLQYCLWIWQEAGVDTSAIKPLKQGEGCPYMSRLDEILNQNDQLFRSLNISRNEKTTQKYQKDVVELTSPIPLNTSSTDAGSVIIDAPWQGNATFNVAATAAPLALYVILPVAARLAQQWESNFF